MTYKYKTPTHVFTTKSGGINRMLYLDLEITPVDEPAKRYKTRGIWDTGATGTVITQEIADALGLKQAGITSVSTATISHQLRPTYFVDVFLKPDICVQAVEVTVGNIAAESGFHCLIGMDIITIGDFSITNLGGKTTLSFRIPSQHEVDFVKKFEAEKAIIEAHFAAKLGMNNPCICKSGRKFKNCHGKDLIIEK